MTVLDIQRALLACAIDPGPLDGKMGARTRKAIEAFQRSAGLSVTGVADIETLRALKAAWRTANATATPK